MFPYNVSGSSINSKTMRYANMVNNSEKYIITTYRAPSVSGTVLPGVNPILNGIVTVQGNLNVISNYYMDNLSRTFGTGYLNVLRDITSISGDVHTNDIYISGNIYFPLSEYGFKSNIYSPSLKSVYQNTNAIYSARTNPYSLMIFGENITNQIYYSYSNVNNLFPSTNNPFLNNFFNGYCTHALWNGVSWVATGCGQTCSIATSYDGLIWSTTESYSIFNIGNTQNIPYGGTYSVEWNGEIWVVGGYGLNATIAYSKDNGHIWIPANNNPFQGGYCTCVKWNGKIWLASGSGNTITSSLAYSYDAKQWTSIDTSNSLYFPNGCLFVEWNGIQWIAGGASSKIGYSLDGINWSITTVPIFSTVRCAGWNPRDNMWLIGGDSSSNILAYSYDGFTWNGLGTPILKSVYSTTWLERLGYWVATGTDTGNNVSTIKTIMKSIDGFTWENVNNNTYLNPCYGVTITDKYTGYFICDGNIDFLGEQITIQKNVLINGNKPTFNLNTGSLVIKGGISNTGNTFIGGNSIIFSTLDSISTNTGSLIVKGGIGIGGNIFLGKNITCYGTNESYNIYSGAIVTYGGIGMTGNLNVGNNLRVGGDMQTTSHIHSTNIYLTSTNGIALDASGDVLIAGNITTKKSIIIQNNLNVSGSTIFNNDLSMNGNLYVTNKIQTQDSGYIGGNLNIQQNLFVNKDISANQSLAIGQDTNIYGNITIGKNISTNGYANIGGNVNIGGNLFISGSFITSSPYNIINTSESISITTGALVVSGGVGIVKNVNIGNILSINGNVQSTSYSTGTLIVKGGAGIKDDLYIGNSLYIQNGFNLLSTVESISTDTGALTLQGGLGISKSINIGKSAIIYGNTNIYGYTTAYNSANIIGNLKIDGSSGLNITTGGASITGPLNIVSGINTFTISGVPLATLIPNIIYLDIDASFGNNAIVNGTQDATLSNNGSLLTYGGATIKKSIIIGNSQIIQGTTESISTATGALVVNGGVGIRKNMNIQGNLYINNYIFQNIYNTNLNNTRNIYLGATTSNNFIFNNNSTDNSVIGYNSGTRLSLGGNRNTFLGTNTNFDIYGQYNNSTAIGYNATISGSNQIVLGTTTESIIIPGKIYGTDSTSITSGALVINGGSGISGNLFCGNQINIYGTTDTTSLGNGSLRVLNGGASIYGNLIVGRQIQILSTSSNALSVNGGIYVAGNTIINKNMKIQSVTNSYSYTDGALVVSGGVGIGGSVNINNQVTINSSINSTNVNNGALTIPNGGVGMGGSCNIGGSLYVYNDISLNNHLYALDQIWVGGSTGGGIQLCYDTYNQYYLTLNAIMDNEYSLKPIFNFGSNASIQGDLRVFGSITSTDTANFPSITINGVPFSTSSFQGPLTIIEPIDSFSPYSGAFIVNGGVGIQLNLNVGQELDVPVAKQTSLSLEYNQNNSSCNVITFNNGIFRNYYNNTTVHDASSIPTNISINGSQNIITNLTSLNFITSNQIVNGGGIYFNGYLWVSVCNCIENNGIISRIFLSTDQINWTTPGDDGLFFENDENYSRFHWSGVAWNGFIWVCSGYINTGNRNTIISYNGANWYFITPDNTASTIQGTTVPGFNGHDVAWNGNMWVSVGRTTNMSLATYSYDGLNWHSGTFVDTSGQIGDSLDSIASANGRIWVACGSTLIYYSFDGINWNSSLYNSSYNFHSVSWNGSYWLCLGTLIAGNAPIIYKSYDGISWNIISTNLNANYTFYKIIANMNLNIWYISSNNALNYASFANPNLWSEITDKNDTITRYPAINIGINNLGIAHISGPLYGKDATFTNKLTITSTEDSGSKFTGAFVVNGGIGIGGNTYIGGNTVIKNLSSGTVYSDANGKLSNTPSDIRYKTYIENIEYGLYEIERLHPVSYYWKDEERFGKQKEIGFIAQEIEHIIPEIVHIDKTEGTLTLEYSKLTAVLVKSIQDLSKQIEEMNKRIEILEQERKS